MVQALKLDFLLCKWKGGKYGPADTNRILRSFGPNFISGKGLSPSHIAVVGPVEIIGNI
jgi:hypothetical protein